MQNNIDKTNILYFLSIEKYNNNNIDSLYKITCFYYDSNLDKKILFVCPTYSILLQKLKFLNISYNKVIFNMPKLFDIDILIRDFFTNDI